MKRYPGVSPFSAEQKNIFFGRDKDIDKLSKLIFLRKQVLLYSKSGIGKTSLLNAGVLPKLQDKFLIVKVRFFAYIKGKTQSPVKSTVNALINSIPNFENIPKSIIDEITENSKIVKSLWYYFKKIELTRNDKFILVFDQFEELFSYPQEQIEEFKQQFYELTSIDIPDEIMQLIGEKPKIEEHEQIDDLYDKLTIKTVFAIRSDRLSLLNKLSDKIHDIQKVFYELNPLDIEQAKQAIINPAKDNNSNNLETLPFEFSEKAIEKVLKSLTNDNEQNIETTQLQIVCQRIENIAQDKQKSSLKATSIKIEIDDLPNFKDIFLNFYEETIRQTSEPLKARKFIEDQLIRNLQRISLDAIICTDYVSNATLQNLENSHLLRAERNSTGGFSYELSHDTLIEPIQSVAKERRQKEEEQKTEKERISEINKIKEQQKRQRKITIIVIIAALISIAFGTFGFVNMQSAIKNEKKLRIEQFSSNFERANQLKEQAQYHEAILQYKEALVFLNSKIAKDSIKVCTQKLELRNDFYLNINEGDSLFNLGLSYYLIAIEEYRQAEQLQYNSDTVDFILNKTKEIAIKDFLKYSKEEISITKNYSIASKMLNNVLLLDPNNKQALKLLKNINYE